MSICVTCVIFASALGQTVQPRVLDDYVEVGVGYVHTALPVTRALTLEELDRWLGMLTASDAQSAFVRVQFERYVEEHNALLDREMPLYLAKAAEASDILQTHGMTSEAFQTIRQNRTRSGQRLMDLVEQKELQFITSLEPILTPEQTKLLPLLEGFASRRKCRLASTTNRWIKHELREVWDALPRENIAPAVRAAVDDILAEYESQLSILLCRWLRAHFDAQSRIQRYFVERAQGLQPGPELAPARSWGRRLEAAKRVRTLHVSTLNRMLEVLGDDARLLQAAWNAHFFPELYPDSTASHDLLTALIKDEMVAERDRALIAELLAWYEPRYKNLGDRLVALCIEWDDDVESGVGHSTPQDLKEALQPLLDERGDLSHEVLRRAVGAMSQDTIQRLRDIVSLPHDAIAD